MLLDVGARGRRMMNDFLTTPLALNVDLVCW